MDTSEAERNNVNGVSDPPILFEEIERPPLRYIDKYVSARFCSMYARYTVAFMVMMAFVISFGMECTMNINTIIAKQGLRMDKASTMQTNTLEVIYSNDTNDEKSFMMDSSFFWGYLISQIPGGILAYFLPANRVFGTAIFISAILNVTIPSVTKQVALIIIRFSLGLAEGVMYPACHGIWRFWAPSQERSRLATIAFLGAYAGILIGTAMYGILGRSLGWHAPFYFYSICGILWFVAWLWLVFEKPRMHPTITTVERGYIEHSLGEDSSCTMATISSIPFREIAKSKPVYAIIVANFCRSWNFYMLVLYKHQFMAHQFMFNMQVDGVMNILPYLITTLTVPFGGVMADRILKSGRMTTTNVRKLFSCVCLGLQAISFLVAGHATTASLALTALVLSEAFSGLAISGYNVNHLDIAPKYASILMGLSNGIGTLAGLFCPIAIDFIIKIADGGDEWRMVFMLAALLNLYGIIFYGIFASGELQPWAAQTVRSPKKAGCPTVSLIQ